MGSGSRLCWLPNERLVGAAILSEKHLRYHDGQSGTPAPGDMPCEPIYLSDGIGE
ncbi:MAG: hypothetical protein NVS2B7_00670 [Herpetosiphon sp.]